MNRSRLVRHLRVALAAGFISAAAGVGGAPRAEALEVFGCTVHVFDIKSTVRCVWDVIKNAASQAASRATEDLLGRSYEILGCRIPLRNIFEVVPCLEQKLRTAGEQAKQQLFGLSYNVAGCQVRLGNVYEAADCIQKKATDAAAWARAEVLKQSVTILGCQIPFANPAAAGACFEGKLREAAAEAKKLAQGASVDVFGCQLSVASFSDGAAKRCLEAKATEIGKQALGKIAPALDALRRVWEVVECVGKDVVGLLDQALTNPGKLFMDTIGEAAKTAYGKAASWQDFVAGIMGNTATLLSGGTLSDGTVDQITDGIWTMAQGLGKHAQCLAAFLAPHKEKLLAGTRSVVRYVAKELIPNSIVPALREKILPLVSKHVVDKLMGLVLGEEAKSRVKERLAELFAGDNPAIIAGKLSGVLSALKKGDPKAKELWREARALLAVGDDYGARKTMLLVQTAVKVLITEVVGPWLIEHLTPYLQSAQSQLTSLINRVIDGLAGLIPEVGAGIFTIFVAAPLRFLSDIVAPGVVLLAKKVLTPMMQVLTSWLGRKVLYALIDAGFAKLTPLVGKQIDKVSGMGPLGSAFGKLTGLLGDLVYDLVQRWALPVMQNNLAMNARLAEIGDVAVELSTKSPELAKVALAKLDMNKVGLDLKQVVASSEDVAKAAAAAEAGSPGKVAFAAQRGRPEAFSNRGGALAFHYFANGAWQTDAVSFRHMKVAGRFAAVFNPAVVHSEVFFRGADGYLHRYSVDPKVGWQHDGKSFRAAKVAAKGEIAAVYEPQRGSTAVFFHGEDGYLHYYYFANKAWQHDGSSFRAMKVDGAVSAVFDAKRAHASVFFRGADGYLHAYYVSPKRGWKHNGKSFRAVAVQGPVRAVYDAQRLAPAVFVRGADGFLHHFFKPRRSPWQHDGDSFKGVKVGGDVSVAYAAQRQTPEVFFQADDGFAHYFYLDSKDEGWKRDSASFRAAKVKGRLGAVYAPPRKHVELVYAGHDGKTHYHYVEGGAWKHTGF